MTKIDTSTEAVERLLEGVTPGPWWVCKYDAGDRSWYDHNGPCPSIQAPDDQDCAIVHWDGFKQKYWSACNGNQKQIEANARFIAASRDLVPALLARAEAAEARERALLTSYDEERKALVEAASLRQQNKELRAERDKLALNHRMIINERDALRDISWKMRSYSVHDDKCKVNKPPHFDPKSCSCGLKAVIDAMTDEPAKDATK